MRRRKNEMHGMSNTRLYNVWGCMKSRCHNKNDDSYDCYGGKGITVCKRWRYSFLEFYKWAMANGYKEGLTIDRIDVNKGYQPTNCQWITRSENSKKARHEDYNNLPPEEIEYRKAIRKYVQKKKLYDEVVADMLEGGKDPSTLKKPVRPKRMA